MVLVHLLQLPDTFGHAAHEFRCCEHQTSRRSDQLRPGNAARLTGVSQSQQRTREPQQGRSEGSNATNTHWSEAAMRSRTDSSKVGARGGVRLPCQLFAQPRMGAEEGKRCKEEDAPRLFSGCFSGVPGSAAAPEAGGSTLTRSSRVSSARCAWTTSTRASEKISTLRKGEEGRGEYRLLSPAAALIRKAAGLVRARRRV